VDKLLDEDRCALGGLSLAWPRAGGPTVKQIGNEVAVSWEGAGMRSLLAHTAGTVLRGVPSPVWVHGITVGVTNSFCLAANDPVVVRGLYRELVDYVPALGPSVRGAEMNFEIRRGPNTLCDKVGCVLNVVERVTRAVGSKAAEVTNFRATEPLRHGSRTVDWLLGVVIGEDEGGTPLLAKLKDELPGFVVRRM